MVKTALKGKLSAQHAFCVSAIGVSAIGEPCGDINNCVLTPRTRTRHLDIGPQMEPQLGHYSPGSSNRVMIPSLA